MCLAALMVGHSKRQGSPLIGAAQDNPLWVYGGCQATLRTRVIMSNQHIQA